MSGIKMLGYSLLAAGAGVLAYAVIGLTPVSGTLTTHAIANQVIVSIGLTILGTMIFAAGLSIAVMTDSHRSPKGSGEESDQVAGERSNSEGHSHH
jgi:hypothetical protein